MIKIDFTLTLHRYYTLYHVAAVADINDWRNLRNSYTAFCDIFDTVSYPPPLFTLDLIHKLLNKVYWGHIECMDKKVRLIKTRNPVITISILNLFLEKSNNFQLYFIKTLGVFPSLDDPMLYIDSRENVLV